MATTAHRGSLRRAIHLLRPAFIAGLLGLLLGTLGIQFAALAVTELLITVVAAYVLSRTCVLVAEEGIRVRAFLGLGSHQQPIPWTTIGKVEPRRARNGSVEALVVWAGSGSVNLDLRTLADRTAFQRSVLVAAPADNPMRDAVERASSFGTESPEQGRRASLGTRVYVWVVAIGRLAFAGLAVSALWMPDLMTRPATSIDELYLPLGLLALNLAILVGVYFLYVPAVIAFYAYHSVAAIHAIVTGNAWNVVTPLVHIGLLTLLLGLGLPGTDWARMTSPWQQRKRER